ncbi:MAG: cytochrome o ubiquinol oxidase subunit IV [Candidatus Saccharimonadales bacterium]
MKRLRTQYLSYTIGYALSLIFTLNAYIAVTQTDDGITSGLIVLLVGLAVAQLVVQLVFFLHLGRESKPRWNGMAFITMCMVVFFIVAGSIWIMNSLDYNMMGDHVDTMIVEDEGIHRH